MNVKRLATHAESFVTFESLARYIADNNIADSNIADNAAQLAGDAS